jgi:hypothetical protein
MHWHGIRFGSGLTAIASGAKGSQKQQGSKSGRVLETSGTALLAKSRHIHIISGLKVGNGASPFCLVHKPHHGVQFC